MKKRISLKVLFVACFAVWLAIPIASIPDANTPDIDFALELDETDSLELDDDEFGATGNWSWSPDGLIAFISSNHVYAYDFFGDVSSHCRAPPTFCS